MNETDLEHIQMKGVMADLQGQPLPLRKLMIEGTHGEVHIAGAVH